MFAVTSPVRNPVHFSLSPNNILCFFSENEAIIACMKGLSCLFRVSGGSRNGDAGADSFVQVFLQLCQSLC